MASMPLPEPETVVYPTSDGKPMAENETQGRQIVRLTQQLDHHFRHRDDVHVGFDLLWYPVEGHPEISRAPDVFVVPGRPQRPRRPSWLQWREDDTPMLHVVEVISPSNTPLEMAEKRAWYSRYGVEEYLVFHPDAGLLEVHIRTDLGLVPIEVELPWTSTLLEGCAYQVDISDSDDEPFDLVLLAPDGKKVPTAADLAQQADAATARADAEAARADALAAKLKAAGIDP